VTALAATTGFANCATLSDTTVRCWGGNAGGVVGDGTKTDRSSPVDIPGLKGATSISMSDNHACAVMPGGILKCWGDNSYGALGDGSKVDHLAPTVVNAVSGVSAVAVTVDDTCAIVGDASLRCWGAGYHSTTGTKVEHDAPFDIGFGTAASIEGGLDHFCALTGSVLFCWGLNQHGEVGDGTLTDRFTLFHVPGSYARTRLTLATSCGLRTDGNWYCWGANQGFALAGALADYWPTPTAITVHAGAPELVPGGSAMLSLLGDGTIQSSGSAIMLGDGSSSNRMTAGTVPGLVDVTLLRAGWLHACALASGKLYCWGDNTFGEIGNGLFEPTTGRPIPTPVVW
jgi:alpha-tubulin suppressor-like RCC1 family protein